MGAGRHWEGVLEKDAYLLDELQSNDFRGRQCKGNGLWEIQSSITMCSNIVLYFCRLGGVTLYIYVFYLQTPFGTGGLAARKSINREGRLFKPSLMNFLIEESDSYDSGTAVPRCTVSKSSTHLHAWYT